MSKVLNLVSIANVQAGDVMILNHEKFVVDFIESDGITYEIQLHDSKGDKVRKCLTLTEMVSIEI
jgi:hypothetical protein